MKQWAGRCILWQIYAKYLTLYKLQSSTASNNQRQMCIYRQSSLYVQRIIKDINVILENQKHTKYECKITNQKHTRTHDNIASHDNTQPSCARPLVNHQRTELQGRRLSLDTTSWLDRLATPRRTSITSAQLTNARDASSTQLCSWKIFSRRYLVKLFTSTDLQTIDLQFNCSH